MGEEINMKVIRSYATSSNGVNIRRFVEQLVEIEIEKLVNSSKVNSPASHGKITPGGDYA